MISDLVTRKCSPRLSTLEEDMGDVLGGVFSELDLGNKWAGQFFTPDAVCRMMAALSIHPPARLLKPAVTLGASEPCVGGGAMVIALARELRSQGINY